MTSDLSLVPSQIRDDYWIESTAPSGIWSENSGKWLLFISTGRIDSVWRIIDMETKTGRLGIAAKVATVKQNTRRTAIRRFHFFMNRISL